jgi:hypothetical protein
MEVYNRSRMIMKRGHGRDESGPYLRVLMNQEKCVFHLHYRMYVVKLHIASLLLCLSGR